MATRNTANTKRILSRPADKKPEAFFIPLTRSGSHIPQPLPPPSIVVQAADVITPRSELATPARRIVVIRNTKHAQDDQGSVDLSDLDRSNSFEDSSTVTDGQKSILFVRRPIVPSEASKPVKSYPAIHEPSHTTTLKQTRTSTSPQKNPRRLKIKSRTPSPSQRNPIRRLPSPNRRPPTYYTPSPSPSPPEQEESQEIDSNRGFYSLELIRSPTESINSQSPEIIENEQQSHPNADHYIPRVSTPPYTQPETNDAQTKSKKNKIIIEMPEQFVSGRQMSPQTRQRSFNKVAKNIRQVVEETKKRYNGDAPSKVIVKVDENTT